MRGCTVEEEGIGDEVAGNELREWEWEERSDGKE